MFISFSCQKKKNEPQPSETAVLDKNKPEKVVLRADTSSIDGIVKALYQSITFPQGSKPNLDLLSALFYPDASFIHVSQDTVMKMDRDTFVASFQNRVESGALTSFHESEITRKTCSFGSIAQIFSSYKKGINTTDPASFGRGINSMQLFFDGKRWWISSIIWEDETEENSIPEQYLYD